MKLRHHLSIKARVTLWYTLFMLTLTGAALAVLFLMSGSLSARQLRLRLVDTVSDAVSETRFRLGRLDEDRLDFYHDGGSLFIYDTEGHLLAPKVNLGVQVDSLLQDQTLRTVHSAGQSRLVYDLYAVQDGTPFWIRGILSTDESARAFGTFRYLILLTFPLFALIAALGGYRITRSAFQPIARMADTARQISDGDDLSLRIETDGSRDELARLAETVNGMLTRLEASFERERQFSSDVSHELRTPLAVIRAQCELALSETAEDDDRRQALNSVYRQVLRMSDIVSQLLMLSRADRGVFVPEKKPLDLSELCLDCCMDLEPAAEAAELSLRWEIEDGLQLEGDETLLHRLVINLLTNAIRYNRPGGSICLTLKKRRATGLAGAAHGEKLALSVEDSGIGIAPEQLDRIWDRFYRADNARSSEGTGLGLAMVKWIAQLHGGCVQVESQPGKGSRFTVLL